jgi:hypothetical protein
MGEAERGRRAAARYVLEEGERSSLESSERENETSSQRMLFDLPTEQGKMERPQGREKRRTTQRWWGRWLAVLERHLAGLLGGSRQVASREVRMVVADSSPRRCQWTRNHPREGRTRKIHPRAVPASATAV